MVGSKFFITVAATCLLYAGTTLTPASAKISQVCQANGKNLAECACESALAIGTPAAMSLFKSQFGKELTICSATASTTVSGQGELDRISKSANPGGEVRGQVQAK